MLSKSFFIFFAFFGIASAFTGPTLPTRMMSRSSLAVGPLQKLTNKKEYNKTIEGLMNTKGLTREQAEKEYDSYLENPTNYALNKVCMNDIRQTELE